RWTVYIQHLATTQPAAVALTVLGLAVIIALRRWRPNWPGFLIALLVCTGLALALGMPAETIGTRFGNLPTALPEFAIPHFPVDRIFELLPSAFTIAFLAGVESLLSAVVADGMIGGRHRSNGELVAQGVANMGSALFGILHAVFLLVFMLALAPLMGYVPLAALAAVLLVVAWNMSERENFRATMSAPIGDRVVLLLTFGLTVFFDLTLAIQAGVVVAALVFMYRMAEAVEVSSGVRTMDDDLHHDVPPMAEGEQRRMLPPGVE